MNRRELLRSAAVLAVLCPRVGAIAAHTALPHTASSPATAAVSTAAVSTAAATPLAIFDERYGDAQAFAAELARHGAVSVPTGRDVGRLWYGSLRATCERGRVRLLGLTPHSDLSVLQACAADHGLGLVYQGCHDCRGMDLLDHHLQFGAQLSGLPARLAAAGTAWPQMLAAMLYEQAATGRPARRATLLATARRAPDHPGTLMSWAIL